MLRFYRGGVTVDYRDLGWIERDVLWRYMIDSESSG